MFWRSLLNVMKRGALFQQFFWIGGHGSILGANVCGDLNGGAMGLGHGLTVEDAAHEGTSEGVACTYGVGHFHLRRFLEGNVTRGEDVAAIGAAGKHKHVEVVLAQDEPAFVLNIKARITKHATDEHQFLIVYFQDVATLE